MYVVFKDPKKIVAKLLVEQTTEVKEQQVLITIINFRIIQEITQVALREITIQGLLLGL